MGGQPTLGNPAAVKHRQRLGTRAYRWAGAPIVQIVARRVALAVPLLVLVSILTFVLVSVTPGNAARQVLGLQGTPAEYASLKRQMGLNLPVYEQYWHWLRHALSGDLGVSLYTGVKVTTEIEQQAPVTLYLIGGALLVTVIVGVGLGVWSAVRGGLFARFVDAFSLAGFALPAFWVAAELIVVFAVDVHWFPATGYVAIGQSPTQWLRSLVLPVAALSLGGVAVIAKQTREAMLDALGSEYIRMAWANGLRARSIIFRHALRNAAIPVATVLGVQAVGLLGGTVIVENVFALPGLGSLVVTAALDHDLPVVEGVAVVFTIFVVVINLIIDLSYLAINPRMRVQ